MGLWSRMFGRRKPQLSLDTREGRADGWKNIMTLLGTSRDKRSGGRFDTEYLAFEQAEELWKQDPFAARIVEKKARASMRRGYSVSMGDRDRAAALYHYMKTQGVNRHFVQAKQYENAYGGAGILPVINDGVKDLTQELKLNRIQRIDGYNVYTPRELYPVDWYRDPAKTNYGKPMIYRVQPLMHGGGTGAFTTFVHESRLIKFPGIRVSSRPSPSAEFGWGDSQLQRVHEALRDIGLNFGNISALLQDFSQGVFKMAGLKDLMDQAQSESEGQLSVVTGAETMVAQRLLIMDQMRSILRSLVMDSEDSFTREQTPITGLADIIDRLVVWFCAVCDIPVTVFFGVSPAGLNATGESDIALWDERVEDDQDRTAPQLDQLIDLNMRATDGPLKGKVPDVWETQYNELRKPSEKDQAQARLYVAQADQIYSDEQIASREEIANSRWGAGAYSPEMTIDWDAREKQMVAAPPITTATPDPEPAPKDPNAPNADPTQDPNAKAAPESAKDPNAGKGADPNAGDPAKAKDPKAAAKAAAAKKDELAHDSAFFTMPDFVARYGQDSLDAIVDAVADWVAYASDSSSAAAIAVLKANAPKLDAIMDRRIEGVLYRGLRVAADSQLANGRVGGLMNYTPQPPAESWSFSEAMARSFATSEEWHAGTDAPPIAVVVMARGAQFPSSSVLLVPPSQTARWFGKLVNGALDAKSVTDRAREREVLVVGGPANVTVRSINDTAQTAAA